MVPCRLTMSDQNHTVIDTKGRWPTSEHETQTDLARGPGIVAVDAQGWITSWNGAAASLLANAGTLLTLGQLSVRLEREAGRPCPIVFPRHAMADGSLICLCEQAIAAPSPAPAPLAAAPLPNAIPH